MGNPVEAVGDALLNVAEPTLGPAFDVAGQTLPYWGPAGVGAAAAGAAGAGMAGAEGASVAGASSGGGASLGSGLTVPVGAGEMLGAGGGASVPLGSGITPGVASEAIGAGALGSGVGPGVTGSLGALELGNMAFSPAALQALQVGGAVAPSAPAGAAAGGGSGLTPGASSQGLRAPVGAPLGGGAASPGAAGGVAGAGGAGGAAGAGAAGGSFVDTLIKQMKDNALGLGLIGASTMMSAGQKMPMPNEQQLRGLGTQAQGVAQQLISQYQSGTISPGQQASVDQLTQNTKNQLRQYFASIGQSNSTAAAQAEAQVDQTAMAMKQQMLDTALQQGLSAIGVAQGPLNTIAQYQLGQDQALRQAFGNFSSAAGTLLGRGAGTPQPQTQPAPPGNQGSPAQSVSSAQR